MGFVYDDVAPLDLLEVGPILHHHLVVRQQHVEDDLTVLREALVVSEINNTTSLDIPTGIRVESEMAPAIQNFGTKIRSLALKSKNTLLNCQKE